MKYLRSLIVIICFGVFGTGSVFINFLIFPFAKILMKEKQYRDFSSNTVRNTWRFFVKLLEVVGLIKVNVKNKEELVNIKNKLIVSTHPSFIDILILISLIPKTTCFVKSKLAKNPVLKNIINSSFITNDTEIDEIKKVTKEFFDEGYNIIVFPMGSRHRKDEHPKIKKGASLIALNSMKNIVPIKTYSSEDFLFINQPFYQGGNKRVIFDIEALKEIETEKLLGETELISKKNITKEIEKVLYSD